MSEFKTDRLSIFPIEHNDLWDRYQRVESQFWTAKGMDLSDDDWDSLTPNQKKHLELNLAFFANSDKIVADNLALNFLREDIPYEASMFYGYQIANENIHNITYAQIIQHYFKDAAKQEQLFNAINNVPAVKKKMQWAVKWINNGTFAEKLVAFACVEMILFSSTFATIFGYKSQQKKLPGLYWANSEISRDEASHGEFAVNYYNNHLKASDKLTQHTLRQIILEAVEVEKQFVKDCFESSPEGFNEQNMLTYVEYIGDTVLLNFKLDTYYKAPETNVNKWMVGIATPSRTNFFEGRSDQYSRLTDTSIQITDDF